MAFHRGGEKPATGEFLVVARVDVTAGEGRPSWRGDEAQGVGNRRAFSAIRRHLQEEGVQ